MATRPVLVVYSRSLLAQAVASLMKKDRRLRVVCLDLDLRGDWERLPGLRPRAIVLDSTDVGDVILQLCRACPQSRVLCLNPASDLAEVLSREERTVATLGDLVAAVKGDERR